MTCQAVRGVGAARACRVGLEIILALAMLRKVLKPDLVGLGLAQAIITPPPPLRRFCLLGADRGPGFDDAQAVIGETRVRNR